MSKELLIIIIDFDSILQRKVIFMHFKNNSDINVNLLYVFCDFYIKSLWRANEEASHVAPFGLLYFIQMLYKFLFYSVYLHLLKQCIPKRPARIVQIAYTILHMKEKKYIYNI